MQEKSLKTWSVDGLLAIASIIEIFNVCLSIAVKDLLLAFTLCVIGIPVWLFIASYLCAAIPVLKYVKFTLYFAEDIPEEGDYHILLGDSDGFIFFKGCDTEAVSAWLIDNPVYQKKVKNVWESL